MSPSSKQAMLKVLKGAGIAAVGAGLTYLLEAGASLDFGEFTPLVVAGLSVLVNVVRKLVR